MKILLYRGRSWVSWLIQKQTRSIYSHAAVELDNGSIVEAWHKGGVRRIFHPQEGHTPGTPVDVYGIEAEYDAAMVQAFLKTQIGKKYDFWSVGRFLTRRKSPANDKWFCSELVVRAFREGGLALINGQPSEHSPRDVALSPYLRLVKQIT
jgi:uncharacterized protein YycO